MEVILPKSLGDDLLSPLMTTFERNGSRALERILGCETAKRLLRTLQRSRDIIHNKFSQINALGKEEEGSL